MKPEIHIVTDPETGAQSVCVDNGERMRVYADGTIEAFGGVIGDILRSEVFPVQTTAYMDWVQSEADKIPALTGA